MTHKIQLPSINSLLNSSNSYSSTPHDGSPRSTGETPHVMSQPPSFYTNSNYTHQQQHHLQHQNPHQVPPHHQHAPPPQPQYRYHQHSHPITTGTPPQMSHHPQGYPHYPPHQQSSPSPSSHPQYPSPSLHHLPVSQAPVQYEQSHRMVKPKRKRATADQINRLNQVFEQTFFPTSDQRMDLAQELGMTPRTVQIWFQNKRQGWRSEHRRPVPREPNMLETED